MAQGTPWPGETPTSAPTDNVDVLVDQFHDALRKMLRTKQKPFHADLRDRRGVSGGDPSERWNQGVYSYTSNMMEDPGAVGDEETEKIFQIQIATTFTSNDDFGPPSVDAAGDNKSRVQDSEYIVMYDSMGVIRPTLSFHGRKQNWLNMRLKSDNQGPKSPEPDVFVPAVMRDVSKIANRFRVPALAGPPMNPHIDGDHLKILGFKLNPRF